MLNIVGIMYSEKLTSYDFGEGHPLRGKRFSDFLTTFQQLGLDEHPHLKIIQSSPCSFQDLLLVHSEEYLEKIQQREKRYESLSLDTPLRPGMFEAAMQVVGASLNALKFVLDGHASFAVGLGGGMHHAFRNSGGGFCIVNDVAICAEYLRKKQEIKRILILDTDAHYGDGTANIFYETPEVLFISIHQNPSTLYPGTGYIREVGRGDGEGYNVNVPMPVYANDSCYELTYSEIVLPLVKEFKPEIIIRNGGSDPHFSDKLTDLGVTLNGLRRMGEIHREIMQISGSQGITLIGSGYNPIVLPYGWLSIIIGGVADIELSLEEPIPPPSLINDESMLLRTKKVIEEVKEVHSTYWSF
ncbi:MAG: histone deacetylase family protein [Candidatus Sifarchaeia archaeon]